MLPDRVSNPGPLTYESGALPTALRGPAPASMHCEDKGYHIVVFKRQVYQVTKETA